LYDRVLASTAAASAFLDNTHWTEFKWEPVSGKKGRDESQKCFTSFLPGRVTNITNFGIRELFFAII